MLFHNKQCIDDSAGIGFGIGNSVIEARAIDQRLQRQPQDEHAPEQAQRGAYSSPDNFALVKQGLSARVGIPEPLYPQSTRVIVSIRAPVAPLLTLSAARTLLE